MGPGELGVDHREEEEEAGREGETQPASGPARPHTHTAVREGQDSLSGQGKGGLEGGGVWRGQRGVTKCERWRRPFTTLPSSSSWADPGAGLSVS